MAHRPNYTMQNYSAIWARITPFLKDCDLAFCNIEAPVSDNLPLSTYPQFNMHNTYPAAALDAGFSVLSLINNHSNDQGERGILDTIAWSEKVRLMRKAYFSGLKARGDEPSFALIEKNGWRVLFLAITELLNLPHNEDLENYFPYTKSGQERVLTLVGKLKKEHPCDLFVLSVHVDDPEYIEEVSAARVAYFHTLIKKGVDVIWANHPHIIREHEVLVDNEKKMRALIMYGLGNTISAQRTKPDFSNPENARDKTGDGLLLKVRFTKPLSPQISPLTDINPPKERPIIDLIDPYYITTIKNKDGYIIAPLNEDFATLCEGREKGSPFENQEEGVRWGKYLRERIKIVNGRVLETSSPLE